MEESHRIRVAINGFGRIGRAFVRLAYNNPDIEIVAINDLGELDNLAYLLRYDTAYGKAPFDITVRDGRLVVNQKDIIFVQEKDPEKLPWKEHNIDVVVECTGLFERYDKANAHIIAGAQRVVISAPAKEDPTGAISGATVLLGINEDALKNCAISSNASCTTNAASPVIQILHEGIGIERAMLNTVHGYTATQKLVDAPDAKDWRRGRAAAQNIVPSSTGAAISVTEAVTELKGKFDGIALRVPVIVGSVADITFIASRETTKDEVNAILTRAAGEERWKKLFAVTNEQLVSSDIVGISHASLVDLSFTRVIGNLVKVLAWYDNESGYTHALIDHVIKAGHLTHIPSP